MDNIRVARRPQGDLRNIRDRWVMDVQANITVEIEPGKPMSRRTAEAVALEEAARQIAKDPALLAVSHLHHDTTLITAG